MRNSFIAMTLAISLFAVSNEAHSASNKRTVAGKRMSYQQAKKNCLKQEPNLSKEELKFCIKEQRKMNK